MASVATPSTTVSPAVAEPRETRDSERPAKLPRRRACNECKQQKLRCDLATGENVVVASSCSRCRRLNLECKVETAFRRTRKRRRSFELEIEVKELRRQLSTLSSSNPAREWQTPATEPRMQSSTSTSFPTPKDRDSRATWADSGLSLVTATTTRESEIAPSTMSVASGPSPESTETSRVPGLTTKPVIDQPPQPPRRTIVPIPQARILGNVSLSVKEIDELYLIYVLHYHPYLPFLDPSTSLHEYYESSELLFWSIISVAARRLQSNPTLLSRLARNVTDFLWKVLRSIPYSLRTVQSLIILCTWPFPTSSSTADPTYMLAGMMVQIGTQMGLHRALNAEDFLKIPLQLSMYEYSEWVKTWEACNIVAQSVSVGCGLPATIQMHDWSLTVAPESTTASPQDVILKSQLRIEQFRHRVSQALTSNALDPAGFISVRERLSLYRLLNSAIIDLEREAINMTALIRYYVSAARLHLHSFYLFDDSTVEGYSDRMITLYHSAHSLIEQCLEMDSQDSGFFFYCPFFCYQVFVSAAFIVLKITMNGFFQGLLDIAAGKKLLDAAISALRKMSVTNNDLPGRLSDVISFFCSLPDPRIISGASIDNLQLNVRNRLSMSIVYDSLWEWRRYFQAEEERDRNAQDAQDNPDAVNDAMVFDHLNSLANTFDIEWPG